MNIFVQNEKKILRIIWVASIVVPLAVAVLLSPSVRIDVGFDTSFLPKVNAFFNSIVTILLVIGAVLIKQRKIEQHKKVMLSAFVVSALFLVSYVLYHITTGHTSYCDAGPVPKAVYFFILFSHIGLSIFIIPLASFSIFRGLTERFDKHRKIAKITLPLWLYVSITGVLVYFLISPCYA